jgi:hypothetical protein
MYPVYRGMVDGLSSGDIAGVRSLYADPAVGEIPAWWTDSAIGATGSASHRDDRFTIQAGGRDIWDAADELRFVWRPLHGDGDIVARVDSLAGTHRWSKAGVMIRASEAPGSPHAFALVSRDKGVAFQRRRSADAISFHTDGGAGAAPLWLWLSRRGARVDAYAASDHGAWRLIGSDIIALGATALAGLAVTNHDAAGTATAVFSHVAVTAAAAPPWTGQDVGAVGRAGSWSAAGPRLHVRGAGADVWGAADAFQFVWQPLDGDGEIVARVARVQYTRSWAKAGVMIRDGLEPGAAHAFMLASAGKGYAFQRRPLAGGPSFHTAAGAGRAPGWIKLQRSGDLFRAFRSVDGVTWTLVGSETIPMGRRVLAGLAVSSHTTGAVCEAIFENVSVGRGFSPAP